MYYMLNIPVMCEAVVRSFTTSVAEQYDDCLLQDYKRNGTVKK